MSIPARILELFPSNLKEPISELGEYLEAIHVAADFTELKNIVSELAAQKRTEEQIKILVVKMDENFNKLGSRIDTVSTRSGRLTEHALRNGLTFILKSADFTVERYHQSGKEIGEFELDIVLHNGISIAVEVKSSFDHRDAYDFQKKVIRYSELTGIIIQKKMVISPDIDPRAAVFADKNDITLISHFDD